jgi:putative peptidoglycan lipid II flippase
MTIHKAILKDSFSVSIVSFFTRILGFVAMICIVRSYGRNETTDTFFLAMIVPTIFLGTIAGAMKYVIVPTFTEYYQKTKGIIDDLLNSAFTLLLLLSLVTMVLVIISLLLLRGRSFFLGNLPFDSVATMIIKLSPLIPISCLCAFLASTENVFMKFTIPTLFQGIRPISIIVLTLWLHKVYGIDTLVLAYVLGSTVILILHLKYMSLLGIRIKATLSRHNELLPMAKLALYPTLAYTLALFHPIIDKLMSAFISVGDVSALNYAQQLNAIPLLIFGDGYLSVLTARWAKEYVLDGIDVIIKSIEEIVSVIIITIIPLITFLYVFQKDIVDLLFLGGSFRAEDSIVTASVFGLLALGIVPGVIFRSLIRVYIIKKDTKTAFYLSIPLLGFNVVLNIILAKPLGVAGIALSTSITWVIQMGLCYYLLCKQCGYFPLLKIKHLIIGIFASVPIVYLIRYFCDVLFDAQQSSKLSMLLKLVIGGFLVASLYYLVCYLFKIDEARIVYKKFGSRLGWESFK